MNDPKVLRRKQALFDQLNVHLLLNLSRCRRQLGDCEEAARRASQALAARPGCLEALHARARAYRQAGHLQEAVQDLTEDLRVSPQNREVHRLVIKVREELRASHNNNNNNDEDEDEKVGPVGASEQFKFVDDAGSSVNNS